MADLQKFLEMCEPSRLAYLDFDVDAACRSFPLDGPVVKTYPEFQRLLGRYYQHLTCAVCRCDVALDEEWLEGTALDVVERAFKGGRVEAFDRASSGREGGLPGVLKTIAEHLKKELRERRFSAALRECVDMADWDDRRRLAAAYLKKFRHVLPPDFDHASPLLLATRLREVLWEHVQAQQLIGKLPTRQ